jgi:hypothetical protein
MDDDDEPCKWVGGNDVMTCLTCGAEYDYRRDPRPPCPKLEEKSDD